MRLLTELWIKSKPRLQDIRTQTYLLYFTPYLVKLQLSLYLYNNHKLQYNTHDRQDRLHFHFPPAVYMHALSFYKR